jgi:asparagine synthase (glutamine-hydrolysing)
MVADRYATDHHEQVVTPSIHDCLSTLVKHFDEPFADSSAIPALYLSKMTRQYVTVALSGDGADELFAGYRRYAHALIEERVRRGFRVVSKVVFKYAGRYYPKFDYLPQVFRAKTMLTNIAQGIGDAYFTSMTTFRDEGLVKVLSPELCRPGWLLPTESYRQRFVAIRPPGSVEADASCGPGDVSAWRHPGESGPCNYGAQPGRHPPWLDRRLVELAATLPASFKIRGVRAAHFQRHSRETPAVRGRPSQEDGLFRSDGGMDANESETNLRIDGSAA